MKNSSFLLLMIGILVGVIMSVCSCVVATEGMYFLGGFLLAGSVIVSVVCSRVARDIENSKKDK